MRAPATAIGLVLALAACASSRLERHAEVLRTGDLDARRKASMALAEMGEEAAPAVEPLAEALYDPDVVVRWNVAVALGRIGPGADAAVRDLVAALEDPSPGVRQASLWALRRTGPNGLDEAVAALRGQLRKENAATRWGAAVSLGKLGAPASSALPALERLSEQDRDDAVRIAAAEAVERIRTGRGEDEAPDLGLGPASR